MFWIGEKANYRSVWDANWTSNYGGFDNPDPSARRNYLPVAFIPRQNPFYCALPYNDVDAWPVQTGSAARDSVVQTIVFRAGAVGMLAPLARYSQRQS